MKPMIYVALSTFAKYGNEPLELLKQSGLMYSLNTCGRRLLKDEIVKMAGGAAGIVAGVEPYDKYVLDKLPGLRCISRCGTGIDNIDIKEAGGRGIDIRNTPDVVVLPVAELTVGMIFDLVRRLSYHTCLMRYRRWHKAPGNLLAGAKVGVLGLGKIGKKVAEMLLKLNAVVYGADLSLDYEWAQGAGLKTVSTEELLKQCDIITIHTSVPVTGEFVIGQKEINAMRRGALLINTARGGIVDEAAVCGALSSGHLTGAAFDVYEEEPYRGPLCDFDNVILTPHIATLTMESRLQMEAEAVRNLLDYFKVTTYE